MGGEQRRLFRRFDIILLALVIAVSAVLIFISRNRENGTVAVVSVDGKEICRLELNSDRYVAFDTSPEIAVKVENGAVFFTDTECPDKLCEKSGKLTKAGDTAACVPAKAVVTVLGESEIDGVAY